MNNTTTYVGNFSSPFSTHTTIIREIGKHKKVLDVGCYSGYLGNHADSSNIFYGLDVDLKAVKEAKKHYKDAVVYNLEHLKKLPWNIRFDVIVFADVLEHIRNPIEVVQYSKKYYLSPHGKMIISLPNIANWTIRLKLLLGDFTYTKTGILDKTHVHLYTFHTAEEMTTEAGLRVVKVIYGSDYTGYLIAASFGFLKGILATNIILVCK